MSQTKNADKNIQTVLSLAGKCSYNEKNKKRFATAAKAILRSLAKELNLADGTYDVRYNAGGIAVSGEATLHAETVYVQISAGMNHLQFMGRTVQGLKDYTGGKNNFLTPRNFKELVIWTKAINDKVPFFSLPPLTY